MGRRGGRQWKRWSGPPRIPKTATFRPYTVVPPMTIADIHTLRNLARDGRIDILHLNPELLTDHNLIALVRKTQLAHERSSYPVGKHDKLVIVRQAKKFFNSLISGAGVDLNEYNRMIQWLKTKRL